ncbi:hypothetical protein C8T65DRAFT_27150 [Cerioporus squamosus]|nr:hypothetical protein C8T65DRAFT_27150 [Cerioporus squamosus]
MDSLPLTILSHAAAEGAESDLIFGDVNWSLTAIRSWGPLTSFICNAALQLARGTTNLNLQLTTRDPTSTTMLTRRLVPTLIASGRGGSRRAASSWSVALVPDTLYSANERMRKQIILRALEERKHLGFKRQGACNVEISGGYHRHDENGKSGEWLTVAYRDGQGRVIRHEKADGSVWDRVHVYKDRELNASDGERPEKIWVGTEVSVKKVRNKPLALIVTHGGSRYETKT